MSLPTFTQYEPPGVYWTVEPTPTISLATPVPAVVALVGPGIGFRTDVQAVALAGSVNNLLPDLGINTSSIVVTSTDGGTTYEEGTDYTVAATASSDGNTLDTTTTIARVPGGGLSDGQTVIVSYQFTPGAYLAPTPVTTFQAVVSLYGSPWNATTGALQSPLSLAAQIAFDNGASDLILLATPNAVVTRSDLSTAYSSLESDSDANIVVPLGVGLTGLSSAPGDVINAATDLAAFLRNDVANNDILRVGIYGTEASVTVAPDVIAQDVAYARVIEAWPNQMNYFNGLTNTTSVLGGYYLAAAYAGILASNAPQQGLTRRLVKDFTGIAPAVSAIMSTSYKNQLSASGVAVTEVGRNGALWVRAGVTTDTTSTYTSEISLIRSQDGLIELFEDTFNNAGLIGGPVTPETVTTIQGLSTGVLNAAKSSNMIFDFAGVSVVQVQANPTIIQVSFTYQPTYPLNYITFVFSINTATGTVSQGTGTPTQ